jgi:ribosomal protein S27AE
MTSFYELHVGRFWDSQTECPECGGRSFRAAAYPDSWECSTCHLIVVPKEHAPVVTFSRSIGDVFDPDAPPREFS